MAGVDAANVLDVARRRAAGEHQRDEADAPTRPAAAKPASAPAQDREDAEPRQQRREAGDRVAERERDKRERADHRRRDQRAARAAPGDHRAEGGDRQREVAAEDVRVEEDRVDAEVDVELVRVEELRVEEEVASEVLVDRDQRAADGDHPDRHEHPAQQRPRPLDLAEQAERTANGARKKPMFSTAFETSSEYAAWIA